MLMRDGERYHFGEFTLDVSERRLTYHQQSVKIPPKAYDLLVNLVRNAGRLRSKQELLDSVWPDSFVEEGILAVHVSALRKALGEPRLIETAARLDTRSRATRKLLRNAVGDPVVDGGGIPAKRILPQRAPVA